MPRAFIALGSNLGNREKNIVEAIERMKRRGIKILKMSGIIETEPYGYTKQDKFLNAACLVETELNPRDLMDALLEIENDMGRERKIRWGPRNIDLDLIFYEDLVIREEGLTIPHPDAHNRPFVMGPIAEIDPDYRHPVLKKSVGEIYRTLL
ncbi:2-amino-4-hydroxy-6-hydroxymethyldihydropteridine diphosphokinase [Thermosediminibacter oceani]|uniref:2-amino-4-hydroxy-6-hydroxymethyldihydropteridine diphosphokinase n=1 Tax=Thermosediminibacter oceani (strain ATCC BAA-1034 / DSM 16646 / JW/IW-1228P) TaxID=555079 RepID=D9S1R9_THEOJ|nr:2-amino-4-hydroxy-6-hydroxymethyldihydropteridine diphosphokinase [Thermosediminibacter oceani]ADL07346.1 2-amino-4-hydroxy-6-hydroxymethyldihydropteridin epyrophosphokinase [Thermosediminibacter oceani DSM 16646]